MTIWQNREGCTFFRGAWMIPPFPGHAHVLGSGRVFGLGRVLARGRASAPRGRRGLIFLFVLASLAVLAAVIALGGASGPALAAKTEPQDAPIRLLVLGDSLTAGYGLETAEAFPARLEAALAERGWTVDVLDAGVSGDTTAGGRSRLAWALADRPDAAIVALGGNDGLRGLEPSSTRANLDAILTAFAERQIPVLLAGMLAPRNLGADYARAFDAVFPALAAQHEVILHPFFLEGVAMDTALNLPDGIHPNAAGVRRMVEAILPAVERLLAACEPGRADPCRVEPAPETRSQPDAESGR